jgi:hypothetical protein
MTDTANEASAQRERRVAYHEAGHFVVRRWFGFVASKRFGPFHYSWEKVGREHSLTIERAGQERHHVPDASAIDRFEIGIDMSGDARQYVENEVKCGWSGLLAEDRLGVEDDTWPLYSGRSDAMRIRELAVRLHDGNAYVAEPFVEWLRRGTKGLLAREDVWAQVEAVAETLLAERTVWASRLDDVVHETVTGRTRRRPR